MEELEIYKLFIKQTPVMQALYAGLFTWILTALGASLVFFFKSSNRKILDISLGFTGGVMIAASFWSLLSPAISYVEMQNEYGLSNLPPFLPPAIGFFFGALFLYVLDKVIPHLHIFAKRDEAEGVKTDWRKTSLLVFAIALHNIPEGLAVGVAFGALANPELLGMDVLECEQNYQSEISVLKNTFNTGSYDFYFLHYKSADSAGEDGDFESKVAALEYFDSNLQTVLDMEPDVLVICGDHATPSYLASHSWHPVPFLINSKYSVGYLEGFTERNCRSGSIGSISSKELMMLVLAHAGKLNKFGP